MNESKRVEVIVPIIDKDIKQFLQWLNLINKNIRPSKITIIGNKKAGELVSAIPDLCFLDETMLLPVDEIKAYIAKITDNDPACIKRSGWYIQQFLKLEYAKHCCNDFYLSWDGDTFPLKPVQLFDGEVPVLGMKEEYHEPYFYLISKLFDIDIKKNQKSYISEHMLFKTSTVQEMIGEIEKKHPGYDNYYECILSNIRKEDLSKSGFSEFETYGTYCQLYHKGMYVEKEWKSLRPANNFFDFTSVSDSSLKWMSKSYDAFSIERAWKVNGVKKVVIKLIHKIFALEIIHRIVSCYAITTKIERATSFFNDITRNTKKIRSV